MTFPIDDSEIEKTEAKLGLKLPEAFRNAMKIENGGEILTDDDQWDLYPLLDTADRKRLSRTCGDIIKETAAAKNGADSLRMELPSPATAAVITSTFCPTSPIRQYWTTRSTSFGTKDPGWRRLPNRSQT